jgi:hypothetical protein
MNTDPKEDHFQWDRRPGETLRRWKDRLEAETTDGLEPAIHQRLLGLRLIAATLLDQEGIEPLTRKERAALKKRRTRLADARRVLAALSPDELHQIINWVAQGMPPE